MGGRETVGAGPRLPLTFLPSSLGLSLQLLSSPLRNRRRQRPGSAVRAGDSFPPARGPESLDSISTQFPDRPPRPLPARSRGWAELAVPTTGDLRAGGVGGRTRATALFLLHHLLGVPCGPRTRGCNGSPHAVLSSRPGHRPSAPARPSPRWAPRSLGGGPGVRGPSRFNGEAGGFRRAFTHPGGLGARNKGCGGVRDGGCRIGMRGTPKLNGGEERPRVILGSLSHILIIKSKIETMAPEPLLVK